MSNTKKARVISNSEINTFLDCIRKYWYSYIMAIEKQDPFKGRALRLGNIGHRALEVYFNHLKDNPGDFSNARDVAFAHLVAVTTDADNPTDMELGNTCIRVLSQYFDYFAATHPNAIILEVEAFHKQEIVDDFEYGMTLDLRFRDGQFTYMTDHKFTYDFWNQTKIETKGAGQLEKYYFILKVQGEEVDRAMINEIRYRERKSKPYTWEEMFREDTWTPTNQAMTRLMSEQITVSRKIIEFRNLDPEKQEQEAVRSLGSASCEFCDFSSLCISELNGEDITADVEAYFHRKSYDYNVATTKQGDTNNANEIDY